MSVSCLLLLICASTCILLLPQTYGAVCSSNMSNPLVIRDVTENTPVGTRLAKVNFEGGINEIRLTLNNTKSDITLDAVNRYLVVSRSLRVLSSGGGLNQISIDFFILCTPLLSGSSTSSNIQVYVTVYDVNDNAPVFINAPYSANVSELSPVGTTVTSSINATDLDPSDFGYLQYSIDQSSPYASSFSFPVASRGVIRLERSLRFDDVQIIRLIIHVKDNADNRTVLGERQPQFTSTTSITINVLPADSNPKFVVSTFSATVSSRTSSPGSLISVVPPISVLQSLPRSVTYSIVNDGGYFTIDNATGQLTMQQSVETINDCLFPFQIKVSDVSQSWQYSTALVKINMIDQDIAVDGQLPVLRQQYSVTLSEDTVIGTIVAVVRLTPFHCPVVRRIPVFSLVEGQDFFSVNNFTGEIRTAAILSGSSSIQHNIIVKVSDGAVTNYSTVSVQVQRAVTNDYRLFFPQKVYEFNVSESYTGVIGSIQVITTAGAGGSNIVYSLLADPAMKPNPFTIDNTGQISSNPDVPRGRYTLGVAATDGRKSDVALAIVIVGEGITTASSSTADEYRTTIIVIGVVCGILAILLLIVISLLVCVYNKAARACRQLKGATITTPTPSRVADNRFISRSGENMADNGGYLSTLSLSPSQVNGSGHMTFGSRGSCKPPRVYDAEDPRRDYIHVNSECKLPPMHSPQLSQHGYQPHSNSLPPAMRSEMYAQSSVGMDPGTMSSTETLMGPSSSMGHQHFGTPLPNDGGSSVGINHYMSSPDGSMLSVSSTQPRSERGGTPGITVYY